jgi:hypothetical protein
MSKETFKFDSEELETIWDTYCNNFVKKYGDNKPSLNSFKKFINDEPRKEEVLKRLSIIVLDIDDTIIVKKIHKLLKYIHFDFFVNFSRFISEVEKYRTSHKDNKDEEVIYNKLALLRCMQDGQNFLKMLSKYYEYYITDVTGIYKFYYHKEAENKEFLITNFEELYHKADINFKLYQYDFHKEIVNNLKSSVNKIIAAIYNDQAGCCVATPTFNTLDILIEMLRNLNKAI